MRIDLKPKFSGFFPEPPEAKSLLEQEKYSAIAMFYYASAKYKDPMIKRHAMRRRQKAIDQYDAYLNQLSKGLS